MVLFFVVNTTVGSSKIRIPEPFTMPVWLGKITSHHKTLLAENIKHMKRHILTRVIFERTISYRKISVFRIESAKTIVMLSCENHVFNTCILHHFRPLFRIKIHRIQWIFQAPIPFFIFIIRQISLTAYPIHIFRTNGPWLYNARHRVQAPVKQHSKFLILPFSQFIQYLLISRPHIIRSLGLLVHKSLHLFLSTQAHWESDQSHTS